MSILTLYQSLCFCVQYIISANQSLAFRIQGRVFCVGHGPTDTQIHYIKGIKGINLHFLDLSVPAYCFLQ